jgi:hypothetical protein
MRRFYVTLLAHAAASYAWVAYELSATMNWHDIAVDLRHGPDLSIKIVLAPVMAIFYALPYAGAAFTRPVPVLVYIAVFALAWFVLRHRSTNLESGRSG